MAFRILISAALLLAAEVLASASIWCGTPRDWSGDRLHFWTFQVPRLPYWALSFLLATSGWLVVWYVMRSRPRRILLSLLAIFLAIEVEASTSIWCWRKLPWTTTTCGTLTNFRYYFWEHLISWAVTMALGLIILQLAAFTQRLREPRDS